MRERAQALTGRTLEESYEGFTLLLLSAITTFTENDEQNPFDT